ncbi:DinB family protein [Maribacter sp. Asnod1-A12]|uniref:DinB family protein n=1 Tax=Maribacter sp. Asnod1-A12 TaxID=3160576 RepID=UPI00386E8DC0
MIENTYDVMLQNRKNLYAILTDTSKEKLLQIPEGFNNNIYWNIAHTVSTQQVLIYKFSDLQMRIPNELVAKFTKGTFPDGTASDEEMMIIADFLISTVDWLKEDYESSLFKSFKQYTTSAGVSLKNIDDAITFNLFHEGLHSGQINLLLKQLA